MFEKCNPFFSSYGTEVRSSNKSLDLDRLEHTSGMVLFYKDELLFENGYAIPGLQSYRNVSFTEMYDFFYYISTEGITIVQNSSQSFHDIF